MKKILVTLFSVLILAPAFAQQQELWQPFPTSLRPANNTSFINLKEMYYDSVDQLSYIVGPLFVVDSADTTNTITFSGDSIGILPASPLAVVTSIIRCNGKIYEGGWVNYGYGYPTPPAFTCWDGTSWSSMGDSNLVRTWSFTPYQDGFLLFTQYDTGEYAIAVNYLSYFNGDSLQKLYRIDTLTHWDFFNSCDGMAVYNGKIYICGLFSNYGATIPIVDIGYIEGGHLHGTGTLPLNGGYIGKLLVWKDTLFACGSFFGKLHGRMGYNIAKWDGSQWHHLNYGVWFDNYPYAYINDMMVYHDDLYVVGCFNWVDSIYTGYSFGWGMAKWDGYKWCTLNTYSYRPISTLGRYKDSLYVLGNFDSINHQEMPYVAHWIGGDYTDSCSQPRVLPEGIETPTRVGVSLLKLYPSPVRDQLHVQYETTLNTRQPVFLRITDLAGRVVYSGKWHILPGTNIRHINVSGFSPGVYFLTLNNRGKISSVKFVKR